MAQVQYSCAAPEERDRVSVGLRFLFVIPHGLRSTIHRSEPAFGYTHQFRIIVSPVGQRLRSD